MASENVSVTSQKSKSRKKKNDTVLQPRSGSNSDSSSANVNLQDSFGEVKNVNQDLSKSEDETCLICAENIKVASLSPCNHRVCQMCSFRNVALYKKDQCLVCRTEVPHFIYTENLKYDKFDEISKSDFIPAFKGDHGVRFTSEYAKDETLRLLEYKCPIKSCNFHERKLNNFKELNNHVKEAHDKYYCELCAKFKKAFISELKLYNRKQLHQHQTKGDSIGFNGHPECKFCTNKRFYSDDELYVHMRDHHERCHICQQIDPNNPQYFRNYEHLAQHFRSAHYVCTVQSCLDQKFVVFRDEFDLQTHMAKEHAGLMGNNILFSTNTFNNQLYTVPNNKKKGKAAASKDSSDNDNYTLKKKRLEERAKHYLNYSKPNIDRFLVANEEYRNGSLSAQDIVEKYHDIFKDSKDVDYDLLIYELSGLFPSKSDLRKNLEAINRPQLEVRELKERFPALPGTGNSLQQSFWGGGNTSRSSSKLKLSGYNPLPPKNGKSKAKNPWSSTQRVSTINPSASTSYPSLPTTSAAKPATASSSFSPSLSPSYTTSRSTTPSRPVDETLFPSLPKEQPKKVIPRVKPAVSTPGAWGAGTVDSRDSSPSDGFDLDIIGTSVKNVKGKKGKKVVYRIGL
ncbi:hypothetical protein PICMEDRAFT_30690 [Pichia membranifaciens NRRL Y-2026]|uniref:RING-type domain-containing protein n=1 Tax=Pichia membranifaciens NRRL Y-2026 TaxID=763406 RepID=A0A1E3NMM5_9ASCO|nr:hypothetical protein PICMEDRAFT_30690 [Pichia membranifaciens NRRL Y-2026]ODQ47374.1 hypothetical protein PICMEDRAFT_30690 [Pichia membranifaciens NRRL Y-2026]